MIMSHITNKNFEILSWDSEFFGFKVGRILAPRLTVVELENALIALKKEGVTLLYWPSDPLDLQSQDAAQICNGFLADKKVTYLIESKNIILQSNCCKSHLIVDEYTDELPTAELEDLAIQAGIYSRFKIDPRIPDNQFTDLYKLWILNSVNKKMADAVLVARSEDKIIGMVTVGKKGKRADIGLIAVDASMRGKNVGMALVSAAQDWALKNGFGFAQVVTQGENLAACRLYEKCGYHVDKIENIYHFWIQQ